MIKFEQSMTIDQCSGGDHCVVCVLHKIQQNAINIAQPKVDCSENIMELCNAALKLYGNEK